MKFKRKYLFYLLIFSIILISSSVISAEDNQNSNTTTDSVTVDDSVDTSDVIESNTDNNDIKKDNIAKQIKKKDNKKITDTTNTKTIKKQDTQQTTKSTDTQSKTNKNIDNAKTIKDNKTNFDENNENNNGESLKTINNAFSDNIIDTDNTVVLDNEDSLNITKAVIVDNSKSLKTATSVSSYSDLYSTIDSALTTSTSLEVTLTGSSTYSMSYSYNSIILPRPGYSYYYPTYRLSSLTINGNGRTIDGAGSYEFLNIYNGVSVTINNLIITNCYNSDNGGAIQNLGTLTLNNVTFINNKAFTTSRYAGISGGAVYNEYGGTLTVDKCTFINNSAVYQYNTEGNNTVGGAICNNGTATVTNSVFDKNYAGGSGGAISSHRSITINNCTFNNNYVTGSQAGGTIQIHGIVSGVQATINNSHFNGSYTNNAGGSIVVGYANAIIENSEFANSTANLGGVIYFASATGSTLKNNNFTSNKANRGGVIGSQDSKLTLTGNNFDKNNATDAAVIYTTNTDITINANTFTNNKAQQSAGAIAVDGSTLTVSNSIFENNTASQTGGAIFTGTSGVSITSSDFINNTAGTFGGAINSMDESNINVTSSTFKDNKAQSAGAIQLNNRTTSVIRNSNFINNDATDDGGAVSTIQNSGVTITGSKFENNFADKGGVLDIESRSTATLNGNEINNNKATSSVIYNTGSATTTLSNNNFNNNTVTSGKVVSNSATLTTSNNYFYNNTDANNNDVLFTYDGISSTGNTYIHNFLETAIAANDTNVTYNNVVFNVSVPLYNPSYNDVARNGTVNASINGVQYSTKFTVTNGIATITIPTTYFTQDSNTVVLTYEPIDNCYQSSTTTISVDKIPTYVSLDYDLQTVATVPIVINVTLIDSSYKPISGKTITLTINGNTYQTGATDSNGKASVTCTSGSAANIPITATYGGDAVYISSSTTSTLYVSKMPTQLTASSTTTTVSGSLKDRNSNVIPNALITISENGNVLATTQTDSNGNYNANVDLTSGTHRLNVSYAGNGTYSGDYEIITSSITKKGTVITEADIVSGHRYINDTILNVTIKDTTTSSAPVTMGTVDVYVNNTKVGTGTVSNGNALISLNITKAGNYSFFINYTENENYYGSNYTTQTREIFDTVSRITAVQSGQYVNYTYLNVTLLDYTYNPMNNALIILIINNTEVGRGYTNSEGKISIPVNALSGTHNITATFTGNSTHQAVSSEKEIEIIKIPTTMSIHIVNQDVLNNSFSVVVTDLVNNCPVTGGTVEIRDANSNKVLGTGTVNSTGGVIISNIFDKSGTYDVIVSYLENDYYQAVSKERISVLVNPRTVYIQPVLTNSTIGNTTMILTLKDAINGNSIPYADLKIWYEGNVIAQGTTDANGNITVKLDLPAGQSALTFTYAGNDTYRSYNSTATINVYKRPVSIIINITSAAINNTSLNIGLVDQTNGSAVENGTMDVVDLNTNKVIGTGTIVDGKVTLTLDTPVKGNYTVDARYYENDYYRSTNATFNLTVAGINPTVQGTVTNMSIGSTTIEFNITDPRNNNPIPNLDVNITLPNGTVATGTTDENGHVKILIPTTQIGSLTVNIATEDNEIYNKATGSATFNVLKRDSAINFTVSNNKVGSSAITATVTDAETGSLIPNGTVILANSFNVHLGNGTITNGVVTIPVNLNVGNQTIKAYYMGNEIYYTSTTEGNVEILKLDSVITPVVINNTIGNTKINVTLTDENDDPITNAQVIVRDMDGNIIGIGTTDENGNVTIGLNVPVGETTVNVTYEGNDKYTPSEKLLKISADKLETTTTATIINSTVGNTVINVTVVDENNNLVTEGTVQIINNKTSQVIGEGTLSNGKATITTSIDQKGTYDILVKYAENDNYYSSNTTLVDVEVKGITPNVDVKVINNTVGNTTIEVNVTDGNGTPIPDMPVNVTLPNGTVVPGVTDENGTVNITIPTNATGELPINVTTPANETYNNVTVEETIDVVKRNSTTNFTVESNIIDNSSIKVIVVDATTSQIITNGTVVLYVNNTSIGSGSLQNDGTATIPVNIKAGIHDITAVFEGNAIHNPSNITGSVEIRKLATVIEPSQNTTNRYIDQTNIDVTLTDENSNIIPNANITVKDKDGNVIGNGTTNDEGKVTIKLDLPVGEHNITVEYAGNDTYNARNRTIEVEVLKRTTEITTAEVVTGHRYVNDTVLNVTIIDRVDNSPVRNGTVEVFANNTKIGTATVVDGNALVNLDIPIAGTYNITVNYLENDYYTNSTLTTRDRTIVKQPTSITSERNGSYVGNVSYNAVLKDYKEQVIPDATVLVRFTNGTTAFTSGKTDSNGKVVLDLSMLPVGEHKITIYYEGNDTYSSSLEARTVDVLIRPTSISYRPTTTTTVDHALNITVTDTSNNSPVQNGTVKLINTITQEEVGEGTVVNGSVVISTGVTTRGIYSFIISYLGNDYYRASNMTAVNTTDTTPTEITGRINNNVIGNASINITLKDIYGNNIANTQISVDCGHLDVLTGTTDGNGNVTIDLSSLPAGNHNLVLRFDGNSVYGESKTNTTITIIKRGTDTQISKLDNKDILNNTIIVSVTDTTEHVPVHKGTVEIRNNKTGELIATSTVNSTGMATFTNIFEDIGTYNLTVSYIENDYYFGSGISRSNVVINPRTTNITLTVNNNTIGNTIVTIKVTDDENNILPDAQVTLKDENGTVLATETTGTDGTFTVKIDLPAGTNTVDISYPGNETYMAKQISDIVEVSKRMTLTRANITSAVVNNTVLNVTVLDTTDGNSPVQNGTVRIVNKADNTVVGTGKVVNGNVIIKTNITNKGNYELVVEYLENDYYRSSSTQTITVNVDGITPNVDVKVINDTVGNTTIEVNVTDGNGTPIPDMPVNVTLPNGTVVPGVTDENGTVNITIPTNATGELPINVTTPANETYNNATVNETINVVKRNSTTDFTTIDNLVGNTTVKVTVVDATTGAIITNGTVTLYVNNTSIGSGSLQNDGTVSILVDLKEGTHDITAVFEGNNIYNPSDVTKAVSIAKQDSVIEANITNSTFGNTTINVNVTDKDGNPIPNATVVISDGNGTPIVTVTTDENGTTNVTIDIPVGNQNITVTYPGNDTYNNSTKTINVTITKRPTSTQATILNYTANNNTISVVVTDVYDNSLVRNGTVQVINLADNTVVGEGTVVDGEVTIKTSIIIKDTYNLDVKYLGNDYYETSNHTINDVEITGITPNVDVEVTNNTVGNTTIEITVTNGTDHIPDMPINVTLPNGTVINGTTDENGTVNITIPTNTTGELPINVTTPANETYNNATVEETIDVVKRNSTIDFTVEASKVGTVPVDITVVDSTTGVAVPSGTVTLYKDDVEVGTGEVVNGIVTINITLDSGKPVIKAVYEGNEIYNNSTTSKTVSIGKINTIITPYQSGHYIGNVTLDITLADENNIGLASANITIINSTGDVIYTGATDQNGKLVADLDLPIGEHNVTITYNGSQIYNGRSLTTPLTVNLRPTIITYNNFVTEHRYVNDTILNVTIMDRSTYTSVENGTVEVYANNTKIGNATVVDGNALVKLNITRIGNYTLDVKYLENEYYDDSSSSIEREVLKVPTAINVAKTGIYIGNVTLNLTLVDVHGNVIPNAVLVVKNSLGRELARGTTNEEGIVSADLSMLTAQTHVLTVTYDGNDTYQSALTNFDLTISKRPTALAITQLNNTDVIGNSITIKVTDTTINAPAQNGTVQIRDVDTNEIIGTGQVVNGEVIIYNLFTQNKTYNIFIEYATNDYYEASNITRSNIILNKRMSVLSATITNNTIGNTTAVITLTDNQNNVIPNANITITYNGEIIANGTTDEDGKLPVKLDLPAGEHEIIINYEGNQTYSPKNQAVTVPVIKRQTEIEATCTNNSVVNNTIIATVVDNTNGSYVTNGTVEIYNNNILVGTGTVTNGVATIKTNITEKGTYSLTVKYLENDYYLESDTPLNVEIKGVTPNVDVKVTNDTVGNTTIEVNVTDGNGTPIPDMPINVTLPNGTVINGTTDENGTVNITIPTNATGELPINITTPDNGTYDNITVNETIDVAKRNSTTNFTVENNIVTESIIKVTVTDQTTGQLVPNGTVELKDNNDNVIGTGTITNGVVSINVDLTAGNHTIIAIYNGNEIYNPSNITGIVEILKKQPDITVKVVNTTTPNTTINITLTDEDEPIPNATIIIQDNNGTPIANGTTDENGSVIITLNNTLEDQNITVTYPGNDTYYPVNITTIITSTKHPTNTTATITNYTVNNNIIDVVVIDKTDNTPVRDGTVEIIANGVKVGEGTVVNGEVTIKTDITSKGIYDFVVNYLGTDYYEASNTTLANVEIKGVTPKINVTVTNDTVGNTTIEVNVTDGNGTPIPDMPINVTLPNGTVINGTTDENGTVNITIPTNTTGELPINVTTPANDTYENGTVNTTVDVEKRDSITSLVVVDPRVGKTTVEITVVDATTGVNVPNGTVVLKDNKNNTIGTGSVVNGVVTIPVNLNVGNCTIIAQYNGNEIYNPSSATEIVEIIKQDSVVEANITNPTVGNTTINVNVTDEDGNPIPNATVIVADGNGTPIVVVTTDENGTVNVTIDVPVGDHNITVTYPGNDTYNGGNDTVNVTVTKRPTSTQGTVLNYTANNNTISVVVIDVSNNSPVHNGTVQIINLADNTVVGEGTVVDGKTIIKTNIVVKGIYNLDVKYLGNDYYEISNNTLNNVEIKGVTPKIDVTVTNDTVGNTTVEITVTNGTDPIPDMPVNVTLPDGTVINGTTDENGTVNITIPTNATGELPINVTTPANDTYENGTVNATVDVEKRPSATSLVVVDPRVGETTVRVTVVDATTGVVVPNGTVVLKDNRGNTIGTGSVVNGVVTIPISLSVGNRTVVAEYNGNEIYNPSSTTEIVEIIKQKSNVTADVTNATVGNTTLNINVTDENNNPIPNATVVIYENGTDIGIGKTDENGTLNITVDLPAGDHNITVTYLGNDTYDTNSTTVPVTVSKRKVTVSLPDYEMYILDYSNITVNVTDEFGIGVHGGYIIFKVNGKTLQANGKFSENGKNPMKIDVYNGKATVVFNATSFYKAGGINSIIVKYSGSSKYLENSSDTKQLQINKRLGYVEVTTDKSEYKLYETVNIKATYYDITHGKAPIYSDNTTYAIYKINGLTSRTNGTNEMYAINNSVVAVGTDSQSKLNYIQFNYTAPGPHTVNSTVEIKTHNEYYNKLTNTTTFKIVPSPMEIDITSITHNKTSKKITIEADFKDYMNNTISGTNNYCIKINGITYYGNSTGGHIFQVENGKLKITINSTTSNVRSIELVTGQRYAYAGNRTTTNKINVVY